MLFYSEYQENSGKRKQRWGREGSVICRKRDNGPGHEIIAILFKLGKYFSN
jgi:hypothetical protein